MTTRLPLFFASRSLLAPSTSPQMLLFQRLKCGSADLLPPVPALPTAVISCPAVALALLGTSLVAPRDSHAQETIARDEEAASTAQVKWQGPLAPDVAWILGSYYGPARVRRTATSGCSADDGDVCFNGDHEDHNWRRLGRREPEEVAGLLAKLGEAAADRPDDALAFAQLVYAHTRLSDFQETLAVARECNFVAWWCELLLGMVHERGGEPTQAAAYFRSALPDADPALAALLTYIGDLLEGKDGSAYRRLTGRERGDFEQRFWWLANPMWTIPGNERWTAHVRRGVELVLHWTLLEARGGQHGYPHQGLLVRRGPEDSWLPQPTPRPRWTSLRAARYRFTPVSAITDGIGALRYDLEAGIEDERYTPTAYGPVTQVPAQFARFLDGDSLVVVAAARLEEARLIAPRTVFLVSDGPGSFPTVLPAAPGGTDPIFQAVIANRPVAVGIESLDENQASARARGGLLPLDSGGLVLSDPLLMTPMGPDLPETRDAAVARTLGTTTVEVGEELAVYWEVYGAVPRWPLRHSITVEGDRPGMLTRTLRALRIRSAPKVPEVSWTQTTTTAVEPMALAVDIANLDAGDYTLKIRVVGPDGSEAASERRFRVER